MRISRLLLHAVLHVYKAYVCRMDPWPNAFERSLAGTNDLVYRTVWGANEFSVIGLLHDFDRTDRLCEIGLPTLFTCGRYDEATPDATAWYQSLLPDWTMVVFEESAHLSHLEESDKYLAVLSSFLRTVEA